MKKRDSVGHRKRSSRADVAINPDAGADGFASVINTGDAASLGSMPVPTSAKSTTSGSGQVRTRSSLANRRDLAVVAPKRRQNQRSGAIGGRGRGSRLYRRWSQNMSWRLAFRTASKFEPGIAATLTRGPATAAAGRLSTQRRDGAAVDPSWGTIACQTDTGDAPGRSTSPGRPPAVFFLVP